MAFRFQTRLSLAMSVIIVLAILTMAVLFVLPMIDTLGKIHRDTGTTITLLATNNFEYGMTLPERVMDRVGEQMLVSALITSELVAVAERDAHMPPEKISSILDRVVSRSSSYEGYSLLDEIWVTDEHGTIYIGSNSSAMGFEFTPDPDRNPQAHEFYGLLEPGADLVVQPLQARDRDGRRFKYVGVPGVDRSRIVQVGAGERLVERIRADFSVQNTVERFFDPLDVDQILVVDESGALVAGISEERGRYASNSDASSEVLEFCLSFLRTPDEDHRVKFFAGDVGVVTRLTNPVDGKLMALYIQHHTTRFTEQLTRRVGHAFVLTAATIVTALGVILYLSRGLARPIRKLARGVREISRGNLDHRVNVTTGDELQALGEAFNSMAVSLRDRERELRKETRRRERLESELSIASELQQSLLPDHPPRLDGLELHGWSRPAREVGGDFYDFIELGPGRVCVAIGDATGKGLPAALLITECWSVFKAYAEDLGSPADLLTRTNRSLCKQVGDSGRFVTLFVMIVDVDAGLIQYSCAGHNPPVLWNPGNGAHAWLSSDTGYPLGVDRDAVYEDKTVDLDAGALVFLYSDGLTEARNADEALYGEERLIRTLGRVCGHPLIDLVGEVRRDVETHIDSRRLADDMTITAVRYAPGNRDTV
ncbi:MAG: SpoIIE family protein phosphatase [bacterium]|nr:SpoIIE family protein phosphatase [bacterium]